MAHFLLHNYICMVSSPNFKSKKRVTLNDLGSELVMRRFSLANHNSLKPITLSHDEVMKLVDGDNKPAKPKDE